MSSFPRDVRIGAVASTLLQHDPTADRLLTDLVPFASPHAADPDLKAFLDRTATLLCDWIGGAAAGQPLPTVWAQPEVAPGPGGADVDALLSDLQSLMDGAFQPSHPGSLAHLDPPPLTASIAADLIAAGLNNNLLAEELSPSLTLLEQQLVRWFCDRLDLPVSAGGALSSGGTLSNLMALVVARDQAASPDGVILCSEDAHVSLTKAMRVMGLQESALIRIPVDSNGGLCPEQAERCLQRLQQQGRTCLCVVATAGTTVRGAIDPIEALASLCRRFGTWLHVDAAIGGVFALSEDTAHLILGLDQADSITINPQKLLGITKASSLLLVREAEVLHRVFATGLPYMDEASAGYHGGEIGLQGTRPAEVLKLWFGLRQLGLSGISMVLTSALERAALFRQHLDHSRIICQPGALHLVAFCPSTSCSGDSSSWTLALRQELMREGFMLSRPMYAGSHHLKAVLGNPHTTDAHIAQLAACINRFEP
ncbi:MAG: pyridoxal phosphate-dependent decarboxylase family protein [Synechococcus sp.]